MGDSPRILFCSEHCLADGASGAAVSAVEMLSLLSARGWDVRVLCGGKMDGKGKPPVGETIEVFSPDADTRGQTGEQDVAVHALRFRGLPVRVVRMAQPLPNEDPEQTAARARLPLVLLLREELRRHRPDIVLTYGGGWCGRAILKAAKAEGIPSVFWLRNIYYQRKDLFSDVTGATIVPSSFTARHYRELLGLECEVLFAVVLKDRVHCPVRKPSYLTFVSPLPEKGVYFWARVMSEIGRTRPDIEMLIVEGRGSASWLERTGMSVLSLPQVRVMSRSDDPRDFLAVTRVLAFPSVWPETFGRTAVEAMVNGIPVVTSDRGGLPEVVGSGGVVLPIPPRITHETVLLASVAEVRPWVEAILKLWDDEDHYRHLSRSAVASSGRFDPDVISDRVDRLLRDRMSKPLPAEPLATAELLAASAFDGDLDTELRRWNGLPGDSRRLLP